MLGVVLIITLVWVIGNIEYTQPLEDSNSRLKTAAFSGAYVGLKWTVKIDSQYQSFDITSVSPIDVQADAYVNGNFQENIGIGDMFIFSDTYVSAIISTGTYNATYGGRVRTVGDFSYGGQSITVDVETGVLVESESASQSLILTSWGLYKQNIPGYPIIITLFTTLGISVYLLYKLKAKTVKNF